MAATAIALWIQSELTYDRFYNKTDRLYEVFTSDEFQGERHAWGATAAILGPTLAADYPEVEAVVRIANMGSRYVLRVGDDKFEVEWWVFVLTGLAAVVIALLTVSWQAIRAAVANPVESLRDE